MISGIGLSPEGLYFHLDITFHLTKAFIIRFAHETAHTTSKFSKEKHESNIIG